MAYIGQGSGSTFCVWIMMKIGGVKSMAYFALLNIPFIAALLLPALKAEDMESDRWITSSTFVYPVILVTSLLNGFGQGVVQPASGNYIADCANEDNKGFYFALFWSFYMGSQVFGNLLAAFVLGYLPQKIFVLIILGVLVLSSGLLFALKKPHIHHIGSSNTEAVGSESTE
jgi:MFS-type transporter involved in bile tolerance (Atg22 family)